MSEINYDEIDPGIRNTVRWLNTIGYETTDSGDGSKYPAMECARPVGNVSIRLRGDQPIEESVERVCALLRLAGVKLVGDDPADGGADVQGIYSPGGIRLIDIHNIHDDDFGMGWDELATVYQLRPVSG